MRHTNTPRSRDDRFAFRSTVRWLVPLASGLFGMASLLLFVVTGGALHAEEGTFAQRRACEPEVFRLCSEFIPDHAAITNCLQRNKPRLNADCRAVFEEGESAQSDAQHSPLLNKSNLGLHKAATK